MIPSTVAGAAVRTGFRPSCPRRPGSDLERPAGTFDLDEVIAWVGRAVPELASVVRAATDDPAAGRAGAEVMVTEGDLDRVAQARHLGRHRQVAPGGPRRELSGTVVAPAPDGPSTQQRAGLVLPRHELRDARESADDARRGAVAVRAVPQLTVVVAPPAGDPSIARANAGVVATRRRLDDGRDTGDEDRRGPLGGGSVAELATFGVPPAAELSRGRAGTAVPSPQRQVCRRAGTCLAPSERPEQNDEEDERPAHTSEQRIAGEREDAEKRSRSPRWFATSGHLVSLSPRCPEA